MNKIILSLFLCVALVLPSAGQITLRGAGNAPAAGGGGGPVGTDNFTGTNGALLSARSNWALNSADSADFQIQSNQLGISPPATGGIDYAARWTGGAFNANQYAQCVINHNLGGTSEQIGLAVRVASDNSLTFYGIYTNGSATNLFKMVSGSWTLIADVTAPTSGDTIRLEANGTTIRYLINGVQDFSTTDSSIASGAAGVCGFASPSSSPNNLIDNWEGGNL